ncbi:MAG TPA: nitrate reductase cytochrome c-type subunit [Nitrospirota bacterium]|nr:nitrate reductase cytochrome c-type subunit [Nitrospirota bacterium]
MKPNKLRTIIVLTAVCFLFAGSAFAQKKEKSEDDIGIRHTPLTDETKAIPSHGEYGKEEAGTSKLLGRAFENSPPLIPHDLTGMLPVVETNNACLNCHMPEHAAALGATPLPRSHFYDIDTGKDLKGKLDGKRYPCMQCHVPQVNIPEAIKNTFRADFRSSKSRTSSNLLDTLNEGVRTDQ